MIIYNSDLRAFLMQGKDVSYAMYVGEAGFCNICISAQN